MGSADMQRLKMTVSLGKAEWRAQTSDGHLLELPLALELTGFTIDEYPPKLMLIDNETGKTLPEGKPKNLLLEEEVTQGYLGEWQIEVIRHIPQAASVSTPDSVKFVDFHSMGSTYAVYIRARHRQGGEQKEGWVSCRSFLFPYKALRLNEAVSLIMPERESRRFASDIQLYTRSGHRFEKKGGKFIASLWISLERPPMRTMGETRLWYSFFLPLAGLIIYSRWKYKWILSFSFILSTVFIFINLLKPEIHNKTLMPALPSPWFAPHVIVYMFAYAMLGAALILAVYLLWFKKKRIECRETELSDNLVYVGLAFMTLGMLFGALWAKEAWRHY